MTKMAGAGAAAQQEPSSRVARRRRTDAERRHSLRLLEQRGECDRREREITGLQHELADEVRRRGGGWGTDRARELNEQVLALQRAWKVEIEKLRALLSGKDAA